MDPVRARASPEQFSILLEFMERHGDLSRPQAGPQGRLRGDRLWGELTSLLNSIGGGVEKTQDKWKKVWADWKTKTKKKYMLMRRHASGTGGGPSNRQTLTALEERVVAIIGVSAVVGQAGIEEQGFNTLSQRSQPLQPMESQRNESEPAIGLPDIAIATSPEPPASPRLEATTSSAPPPPHRLEATTSSAPPPPPPPMLRTPPRNIGRQYSPASLGHSPQTVAGSPRRRLLRARRNRGLTPFDRAVSEFVAVEQSRLQLEETRDRRLYELETERLRLEAQRIEVAREQNRLHQQLAGYLERLLARSSLPSTVPNSERSEE